MDRTQPYVERALDLKEKNNSRWVTEEAAALLGEQYSSSGRNRLKQLAGCAKTALERQALGSTNDELLECAARAALKARAPLLLYSYAIDAFRTMSQKPWI